MSRMSDKAEQASFDGDRWRVLKRTCKVGAG